MIDAYEIGIQLLLQEDVSAGLAVINRGLAEVDRAIAATSASLTGLVQDAERAVKAVAVAAGARTPQVGTIAAKTSFPTPVESPRLAVREVASAAAPPVSVDGAGPGQPVAAARQVAPIEERSGSSTPQGPLAVESASPASAPSRTGSNETEAPGRRDPPLPADPVGATPLERIQSAPAISDALRQQGRRDARTVDFARRNGSASPSNTIALTAAIGPSRAALPPVMQRERIGAQNGVPSSNGPERMAAAPWSAVDQVAPQSLSARPAERAAAPQSPGRERGDGGGGGTVMLDGRLVGQWLSEHMGREASRPPGGTSFFDARQTPAWNVSGAL